jgi:hypothetical protein
MLFYNKIGIIAERLSEFSLCFYKENGHKVEVEKAICTSVHSKGGTMNIKILPSGEIRKVKFIRIFKFNGEKVYV